MNEGLIFTYTSDVVLLKPIPVIPLISQFSLIFMKVGQTDEKTDWITNGRADSYKDVRMHLVSSVTLLWNWCDRQFCNMLFWRRCNGPTDRLTERPTEGRMDGRTYRGARTHLKKWHPDLVFLINFLSHWYGGDISFWLCTFHIYHAEWHCSRTVGRLQ